MEYAFNKMKKMAKQENIRSIFAGDIHAGIYACLNEISQEDIAGSYREAGHISILGGISELSDRQGCAILALEVVPKN